MSEIWRFQDQSPNKQGEALLYNVDLAAVICFVKHLNAVQAWALNCLSHRCKTDLSWYCDVTFFLYLWDYLLHVTTARICYQLHKAGGKVPDGSFY
jgi:hypothetical protein